MQNFAEAKHFEPQELQDMAPSLVFPARLYHLTREWALDTTVRSPPLPITACTYFPVA